MCNCNNKSYTYIYTLGKRLALAEGREYVIYKNANGFNFMLKSEADKINLKYLTVIE